MKRGVFVCGLMLVGCGGASYESTLADVKAKTRADENKKEEACRTGRAPSECFMAGKRYENGGSRPEDLQKAVNLWFAGCKSDDEMSCVSLSNLAYTKMKDDPEWPSKSFKMFSDLCSVGSTYACSQKADALREGKGVGKDVAAAAPIYEKTCLGYALDAPPKNETVRSLGTATTACTWLDWCLRFGPPEIKDEAKAEQAKARGKIIGERRDALLAKERAESERRLAEMKAAESERKRAEAESASASASDSSDSSDDDEEETPRPKKRGRKTASGGGSSTAGRRGQGFGMGMSRDLACADAKLKATSSAGCDDITSAIGGESCDCNKMGIQWSCQTSVTCR